MGRNYGQRLMPTPKLASNIDKFLIKMPNRYSQVEQVARSPYEVLGNVNTTLTRLIMNVDVAETLITVLRGVDEYSKFFRVGFDHVQITSVEPMNRGIGLTYESKNIGPDVMFKAGTIDFMASRNQVAARWCMDPSNMESLKSVIHAMHFLASQNNVSILDIGVEDPRWLAGRNDFLFLGM